MIKGAWVKGGVARPTNCTSHGGVCDVTFVPTGCEAIFEIFHIAGMLGLSEAHAESVGNLLKRYPKTYRTERVVHATLVRSHGLDDGMEDDFIQLVSARFFGTTNKRKFRFRMRPRASQKNKKARGLGRGSGTVQRVLAKTLARPKQYTSQDLCAAAVASTGFKGGSTAWRKHARAEAKNVFT